MDLRKLKTLIDLVSESNISELEITEADGKVRIVKRIGARPRRLAAPPRTPAPDGAGRARPSGRAGGALRRREPTGNVVKSPMVGTFYRSASPGSDRVRRSRQHGQGRRPDLHHRSDEDHERDRGRRRRHDHARSCARTARPVEFGQPLFVIE